MSVENPTLEELNQMVKDDFAFKFGDDYYSQYVMEIQSIIGDKKIQCDKCHDVFKKPFTMYLCLNKRGRTLWVCPNGCQTINDSTVEE